MSDDVVGVQRVGQVGHLELNRPEVINALDAEMVQRLIGALDRWRVDDAVHRVLITGAGERGLCSGGDIQAVRGVIVSGDLTTAQRYWREEYAFNARLASYPKPIVAVMDGVVMGGGLGLACHASTRLVTERTRVAMPETLIGFFPDVGVCHPLSRAPGETGTHLVMTGNTADGSDAIALDLADAMIDSADRHRVVDLLASGDPLDALFRPPAPSQLLAARSWIDRCYAGDDPVAIADRLSADPEPAAQRAAGDLAQRSPWSVAVALAAVRRAARLSLVEVLEQDRLLSERFAPYPDMVEGVRALLVDRDRTPHWRHASLAEVDPGEVAALFD